jgi:hypothetical protein
MTLNSRVRNDGKLKQVVVDRWLEKGGYHVTAFLIGETQ